MIRRLGLGALTLLALCAAASAGHIEDRFLDAACRVRSQYDGLGSGMVIAIREGNVYVLTARHVLDQSNERGQVTRHCRVGDAVSCDLWRSGHKSAPVRGAVVGVAQGIDAAFLALPQAAFGGVLPAYVPLAGPELLVSPGDTLMSIGCSRGTWATAFRGHALGYSQDGSMLYFTPAPANGRSGSALLSADGSCVVGVITVRREPEGEPMSGGAVSTRSIYLAFAPPNRHMSAVFSARLANIRFAPPCPDGSCGPLGGLFGRNQPQPRPQPAPQGQPWPTLPPDLLRPEPPDPPPAEAAPPDCAACPMGGDAQQPAKADGYSAWWIALGPGVAVGTMLVALLAFGVAYALHLGAQTKARKK